MQKAYISHPASGTVRTANGTAPTKIEGTNFAWWEQQCEPNQDQVAFFQNIVIPPALNLAANFTMRIWFRQVDPGTGNVLIDPRVIGMYGSPPVRDIAPLTLGAVTVAVPGTVGQEASISVSASQAGLLSGVELLLAAARVGTNPADTFTTGKIAFTRVDFAFEVSDPGSKWLDGVPPNSIYYGAGPVGINTTNPGEWLHVAGGIRIGNTINNVAGNIRYTGTDFEGYDGSLWKSFTAAGSGEANTASNLGTETTTQRGLFTTKVGLDLPFKRIKAGTNVTLGSDANYITINATGTGGGEANTASNRIFPDTVTVKGLFYQKNGVDLEFKSLQAGSNITLTADTNTVTITGAAPGETNTASNRLVDSSTQKGLYSTKVGVDLQFKVIKAGTGVTLGSDADSVTITATGAGGGEANTASNRVADTASIKGLFYQKNGVDLEFKAIQAGTNVTLSTDTNTVTINATGGGAVSLDGAYNNGSTITVDTGSVIFNSSILTGLDINQSVAGRGLRVTSSVSGADGVSTSTTAGDALYAVTTTGRAGVFYTSGGTARTQPLSRWWYAAGTYNSNTGIQALEIDCGSMTPNPATATGAIYLKGVASSNAFYAGMYCDPNWDYGWYSASNCWMAPDRVLYFGGTDTTTNRQGGSIWLATAYTPDSFRIETYPRSSAGDTDQIFIGTGNAADGNTGNITIQTGTASSIRGSVTMAGGAVGIQASTGALLMSGVTTSAWAITGPSQTLSVGTSGSSSNMYVTQSGPGGSVNVTTGNQSGVNTGNMNLVTGNVALGTSANVSGNVELRSGTCYNGRSGYLNMATGDSDSTSVGSGNITMSTGDQTYSSSSGNSGLINIFSGDVYNGTSGAVYLQSGRAVPTSGTGNTGTVYITSGRVGLGSGTQDGNSGNVDISTGQIGSDGNSGNIRLVTGSVAGSGTQGYILNSSSEFWVNNLGSRVAIGQPGLLVGYFGIGTSNPSPVWPKGSVFSNVTDGKLYISSGAVWVVVGTQT